MGMNPMGMGRGGMGMNMGMQRPPMQNQGGMNYAGAVKNEQQDEKKVQPKQEPMNMNQSSQEPKKKKLRLEQMGFGNMGAGFGCSQFVANQGEEMPTMLQMGYAGEGPGGMGADEGTGFGDYADDVKTEFKGDSKDPVPVLGKSGPVGSIKGAKDEKKTEWPPSLMDYISRAFSACRNDKEKDKTESYLKNLLNDIFTDKNKDKAKMEKNTARDCMYDPKKGFD